MKSWYKEWFESQDYLKVYNHRDFEEAQKFSDLILSVTNIKKGSRILDAACGSGRHAIYFALKGYDVYGFDLSRNLLNIAKENSMFFNTKLNLVLADIRKICFNSNFDLILNLFTSFGYFETDEENFSFIRRAYNFLNKNGYYVIDYFNKTYLENNLVPQSEKMIDDTKIIEKRKIVEDRVIKEIIIKSNESEKRYFESVKLYEPERIINEFKTTGYRLFKMWGDYDGHDFSKNVSPRIILFFQK